METSRKLIKDEDFKARHRSTPTAFTRLRALPFSIMMLLLLRKSLKSLQLVLNEFFLESDKHPVTASAFTQARAHLRHTAFIELNQKAVVEVMYRDDQIKRYKGMRVLGIDGSKILLPQHPSVIETFGEIAYSNDHPEVKGAHAYGVASVLYDVLNRVAIDSTLGKAKDYEVELAIGHLAHTRENDVLLCDRNYASYRWLALLCSRPQHFVIRCSAGSFLPAREMLQGKGADDQRVTLKPDATKRKEIRARHLPEELQVRFVRVKLVTGEDEVLVTNVMDRETYPTQEFQKIYEMRWDVEGFYKVLKSRLNLENFTGKTAESVYQDFYASVYLTGLESILTMESNERLAEKETQHSQQVNHVVSFNAIKNEAFELLYSDLDSEIVTQRLETLFLMNPSVIRKDRKVPRKKRSERQRLNYWKRKQKICF